VGVHGANRLASNSLLEAVVFSNRIIQRASGQVKIEEQATTQGLADIRTTLSQRQTQRKVPPPRLAALQTLLWNKVGIIRNKEGLTQAADTLASWQKLLPQPTTRSTYELSNLLLTGRLVVEAALLREESRGAHFRTDFPKTSPQRQGHLVFNKSTVYP
jgi:L-aspartate oxidase